MKKPGFKSYADLAMREESIAGLRPVVEKELLHYEILQALSEEGILRHLVFQGGAALRLCHGAVRYSEDLGFSGGPAFTPDRAGGIAEAVSRRIGQRYGLPVALMPPRSTRQSDSDPVRVSSWSIRIETEPMRRDMPAQKIRIDIDTTRSLTREGILPRVNYDFLPTSYGTMLIPVQTRTEIMSAKVVSLAASMHGRIRPRHRDIWDLYWLERRNIAPDVGMIGIKAAEHGIENLPTFLETAIEGLPEVVISPSFNAELSRFLPAPVRNSTIQDPAWLDALIRSITDLLRSSVDRLTHPDGPAGAGFEY